jgi:hypothetical protein
MLAGDVGGKQGRAYGDPPDVPSRQEVIRARLLLTRLVETYSEDEYQV